MPYEYFPAAAEQPPVVVNSKPNWLLLMSIALFLALCLAVGYIIWEKDHKIGQLMQPAGSASPSAPLQLTGITQDSLRKELLVITERYAVLKEMNAAAGQMIGSRDSIIDSKTNEALALVAKINASASELLKAKQLIGSLAEDINGLKKKVEVLTGEKIVLQHEKQLAVTNAVQVRQNLDSAKEVIKQKDELLEIGATLSASAFTIISIQEKTNGKEKATTVAKKVDKLRISFDINPNQLSVSGQKELFVCITGPDGIPIAVEALGSGVFSTRKGEDKRYTQKVDINYLQGTRQTINFDWRQNRIFESGLYKIEVFHNGFKIGGGIRYLKKTGLFTA